MDLRSVYSPFLENDRRQIGTNRSRLQEYRCMIHPLAETTIVQHSLAQLELWTVHRL